MNLKDFLGTLPHGGIVEFAKSVPISEVYLHQLAAKQDDREPSARLAYRLEQASALKVRRWELRSDWFEQWPDLIGSPGAPKVPKAKRTNKQAA